jgi:tRNA dimethylallyltransferase
MGCFPLSKQGGNSRFFEKGGVTVSKNKKIVAVVGPTASGKSALAEELAQRLGGEVVSCDSMQIYRGMDIGTAKPTAVDRAKVAYHLLDVADPHEPFSMVDYVLAADAAIAEITARGRLPILCGGTGLYLDAVLRGAPESPGGDPAVRAELAALAEERGNEYLHGLLCEVDAESGAATHASNLRRVIRALEIYRTTGIPKSEWDRRSREQPPRYDAQILGLFFQNRELLYGRIERRVDEMIAMGLVEETARLSAAGVFDCNGTAAAAIGYKELLPYLRGECTLEEAIDALKTATRRYAKRQITWFSAKPYITRLVVDDGEKLCKFEQIVNNALAALASNT